MSHDTQSPVEGTPDEESAAGISPAAGHGVPEEAAGAAEPMPAPPSADELPDHPEPAPAENAPPEPAPDALHITPETEFLASLDEPWEESWEELANDSAPSPEVDPGLAPEVAPEIRAWNHPVAAPAPVSEAPAEAGEVRFSVEGGTYAPPITLSLSTTGDDAEIRYTLDGSEPTPASPLYTPGDPIFLGASATVAARAFRPGAEPGPAATHPYEMRSPQWKMIEPADPTDGVPHQISEARTDFTPGWNLAAASIRGRLHAHRGAWREDAYEFDTRGPWSILAVSDGAGSAALSRVGSRAACSRAVEHMRLRLPDAPPTEADEEAIKVTLLPALRAQLANAARAAIGGLREAAAERGEPVDAFAATLILVVCCPWQGRHLIGCLQVGDGQFALLTEHDGFECKVVGDADHGAHSAETRFLTTRGVEESLEHRVKFTAPERLVALALMTDGISDDFFPEDRRMIDLFVGRNLPGMIARGGGPVAGVVESVASSPTPGDALREWIEYERKGSSDDRTLLLLWSPR